MNSRQAIFAPLLLLVLLIGVVVGLFYVNQRVAVQNPGGEDFLVYWAATRSFLLEGESPYLPGMEAHIQAQAEAWGLDGEHTVRKALFPFHTMLFFIPFALVESFPEARAAWMTLLQVALALLAIASLNLVRWRSSLPILLAYLGVALFGFNSVLAVIQGNAVILTALQVVLSLLAIRAGLDEVAALLLVFAMLTPLALLPVLLFITFWAVAQGRWRLIAWLVSIPLILGAVGMFFLPNWPLQYLRLVVAEGQAFWAVTPWATLAANLPGLGLKLGQALSALVGLLLLVEWWLARSAPFGWFLWTACLTLVLGQWLGLPVEAENYVLLLAPLGLVFTGLDQRWKANGQVMVALGSLVLFILPWWVYYQITDGLGLQGRVPILVLIPAPILLTLGLYWVRWWMVRLKQPLLEELRGRADIF